MTLNDKVGAFGQKIGEKHENEAYFPKKKKRKFMALYLKPEFVFHT